MKTLKYLGMMLTAVVLSFSMSACGGDSSDDGDGGSIMGEWVTVEGSSTWMDIIVMNIQSGSYKETIYSVEGEALNTDDPFVEKVYKETRSGSCKIEGSKLILNGDDEFSYTLSSSGKTAYIKDKKGETHTCQRMTSELRSYINEIDKEAVSYK